MLLHKALIQCSEDCSIKLIPKKTLKGADQSTIYRQNGVHLLLNRDTHLNEDLRIGVGKLKGVFV